MKLALISDVHANLQALQATLDDIALRSVDRIVCLGDIVGYNANPAECIALMRGAGALCIAGNHDLAVCGRIQTRHFTHTATRAVEWTRLRLSVGDLHFLGGLPLKTHIEGQVIAVHGALHPQSECATMRLDTEARRMQSLQALVADPSGARICAFGHTHHAGVYEYCNSHVLSRMEDEIRLRDNAYYLINPGTVGQPRDGDRRASYMVLDLGQRTVRLHRVAYDTTVPMAATRQAGLAPAFSFVPPRLRAAVAAALRMVGLDRPLRQFAALLGL